MSESREPKTKPEAGPLTADEIVARVKALGLPEASFVVFGSAPLAVAGIRLTNDIDLLVSEEVFGQLGEQGWQELDKSPGDKPLVHDVFEAHPDWTFSSYNPSLERLLATATVIDGVPFASLDEVKKWKTASARPKDLADLELINKYLAVIPSQPR
jgi:hypothetical protein